MHDPTYARLVLKRRLLPGLVIALSRVTWPARLGAAARRRTGRSGTVELFFAFDDAASAVAVIELVARLASRDVQLLMKPVVRRGIPGDPAVDLKRRYAITDAERLGQRTGHSLSRRDPVDAADCAFLAGWVAAAPPSQALGQFCSEAMGELWFSSDGAVNPKPFAALWAQHLGGAPPAADEEAVRANERLMAKRKPYDTPAAWVHGQWFYAHERLAQIETRLDELGWTAAA